MESVENCKGKAMASIVLLEDDVDLRDEIAHYLEFEGHQVQTCGAISQCLKLCAHQLPDILIVDRMLPDGDGLELVSDVRKKGGRCGVVMFTAKGASQDRIDGFLSGVDQYLTKPVRLQELAAVVRAVGWRLQVDANWHLVLQTWELKSPAGDIIRLTSQEAGFLHTLILNHGRVVSRRKVIEDMGKKLMDYDPRNLDALLLRLRKKVVLVTQIPLPIKTVHGAGYTVTSDFAVSDH
ncbi:MAG: response regulator transcription factor [Pseudomonadota bacterium]